MENLHTSELNKILAESIEIMTMCLQACSVLREEFGEERSKLLPCWNTLRDAYFKHKSIINDIKHDIDVANKRDEEDYECV